MNRKRLIRQTIALVMMAVAALIFAASLFTGTGREDPEAAAVDFGKKVDRRMKVLDRYIDLALNGNPE